MARTNREALIEAGIACLQDRGYAHTTARDVAGRANVSLGAIGYHFGSIDDLLQEALAEAVRRWFEPLIAWASTALVSVSPDEAGPAIDGFLETLDAHRPLVVAYFEALVRAEHVAGLREAMAADFDTLRTAVTAGIDRLQSSQPPSRHIDAGTAATLVMAAFDGLIIQWLLDPGRLLTGDAIVEMLRRAAALTTDTP